jgi:hypothetical protein
VPQSWAATSRPRGSLSNNAYTRVWRKARQIAFGVHVLMEVYAKCVGGQEEAGRDRVEAALWLVEGQAASPPRVTRS